MKIAFKYPTVVIQRTYGGFDGTENYYSVIKVNDQPMEVMNIFRDKQTQSATIKIKTAKITDGYHVEYINVPNALFRIL